ncbi:LPS biosynthesis choline kinase [Nostocales cyanobacterium HT-58-2]|nr:LPS biosynthesis choline kinase [Nostocales cyanobacterium HT-58-2]
MTFLLSSQNVFEYLINKGLCTQKEQSTNIELKPAKNFNLLLSLPDGRQLLVKQELINHRGKSAGEFLREWQIQKLLQLFPEFSHMRSSLSEAIYFDVENSIIVFNYLNDYSDLQEFYFKENTFPTSIATAIGSTVALVHRLTLDRQEYRELLQSGIGAATNQVADLGLRLERITPEVFGTIPGDGITFFTLYQRYDSLGQAIAELSTASELCCLSHNDLKLNNVLLSNNWEQAVSSGMQPNSIIRLIDWEKSSWGDPASDLGMLIASYLQMWLYGLVTNKTIAIEESLRLATIPLELLQPSIASVVSAYLSNFPEILERRPDFLLRVVQFAGLALINAILAALQHEKTFGNPGICMLQVAKALLCRPEQSIETVFGTGAFDLTQGKVLGLRK